MRVIKSIFLLFSIIASAQKTTDYKTYFEKGNGNQSANYQETIRYYKTLDANFQTIKMEEKGLTDSGEPLHIVTFNPDKYFDFTKNKKNKATILINNGIHAGEPDGIDATMQLFRDLALGKIKIPVNTIVVTIPIYNIDGALNRNSTSRANQNGPEEYGFRSNGRNFDLNRDFIKSDTKNTKSFVEIFHQLNPEIFIDNHVSNGADYQYTLTYIQTQHNKLGKELGDFLQYKMTPAIVTDLQSKKVETTPYVNIWNATPDKGFAQFFETPRYATGYTSLFNTIGYVVETHMLKNYKSRVKVTYDFMVSTLQYVDQNVKIIKDLRIANAKNYQPKTNYTLQWKLDSSQVKKMKFLGFEGSYKKSDVTTGQRLFYDKNKPFSQEINFYPNYKSVKEVIIPKSYVVPKSQWEVLDLLKNNNCKYSVLKNDSIIEVESYKILDYKTVTSAYEGHYNHRNTTVSKSMQKKAFSKGDYIFTTKQPAVKYLLETLEPEAVDSFFNWNFFDTILQQKEGFSDYVFEDLAFSFLNENLLIKTNFEEKKKSDNNFAKNPEAQLEWIYKNSPYYESAHLQYPVYRILH